MRYEKLEHLLDLALDMRLSRVGVSIQDIQNKDRVDVILANPPFGGKEKVNIQETQIRAVTPEIALNRRVAHCTGHDECVVTAKSMVKFALFLSMNPLQHLWQGRPQKQHVNQVDATHDPKIRHCPGHLRAHPGNGQAIRVEYGRVLGQGEPEDRDGYQGRTKQAVRVLD